MRISEMQIIETMVILAIIGAIYITISQNIDLIASIDAIVFNR